MAQDMEVWPGLGEVVVRPIDWRERKRWEELLKRHHYLGFHALMGESILYVALWRGEWVALLSWSSAALRCGMSWIGYSGNDCT